MVSRDCDYITTLLLCLFLAPFGGHRFYTRKYGTAVLTILAWCCCGIPGIVWFVYDLVKICRGEFTTKEGCSLVNSVR